MPDRPPITDRRALLHLLRTQSEEAIRFSAVFGATHNLHQTDVAALAAIADASLRGAPLGPAALAETLHLSRPATTALVDRLAAVGHVVRRPDPVDRRRTVLEMQPEAYELAAAFFGRLGTAYEQVMDRFSDDDLAVVADFLTAVTEATVSTRAALATPTGTPAPGSSAD